MTTFLVTSLLFPVSTTWGTYLHAAGPAHVLLIVSALLGLDAFIAWVGRPARLDPAGGLARRRAHGVRVAAVPRRTDGDAVRRRPVPGVRDPLRGDRRRAGRDAPPDRRAGADHHELPDLAGRVATGAEALALPNESPESVADLAAPLRQPAARHGRRRARRLAGGPRRGRPGHGVLPRAGGSRARPTPGRPRRSTTFVSSRWPAREWRPVYSAADGRSPVAPRRSRRARPA